MPVEQYRREFGAAARNAQHSMFFFAIPIVAVFSFAMFPRRYFVEHLVYSIHFHAFLLVFLTIGLKPLFRVIFVPFFWVGLLHRVGGSGELVRRRLPQRHSKLAASSALPE